MLARDIAKQIEDELTYPGQIRVTVVRESRATGTGPLTDPSAVVPVSDHAHVQVRTYGCQMNVHDSERLAGLLEDAGYARAGDGDTADVVVFNTCAVRENADNRLYGNLGHLKPVKDAHAGHADRGRRVPGAEGPRRDHPAGAVGRRRVRHPQHRLAAGAARAGPASTPRRRSRSSSRCEVFPSTLPTRRESPYAAWVAISVGCNNTCTFCIVPALRGKEKDRRPGDVLAEVKALVAEGVLEVTLLGQNVNAYGVEFGDRAAFAQAAARLRGGRRAGAGAVHLARTRGTSPTT